MSKKKQNKKATTKANTQSTGKQPHFIIEKDGKAYFKDRKLAIICKPSKKTVTQKYPGGYLWEYEYTNSLDKFKRLVTLMVANGGVIRYVGLTEEEFFNLGGTSIRVDGYETADAGELTKGFKLFK